MQRSPLYSGQIQGIGPRYCPSLEDKVVKFADKDRHQIVLEPEGVDTHEVLFNGMSTSPAIRRAARILVSSHCGFWNLAANGPAWICDRVRISSNPQNYNYRLQTKKARRLLSGRDRLTALRAYEEAGARGFNGRVINAAWRFFFFVPPRG
jgi:tRNA uridine 5-carboxymethylaminomethyl modification enzyme